MVSSVPGKMSSILGMVLSVDGIVGREVGACVGAMLVLGVLVVPLSLLLKQPVSRQTQRTSTRAIIQIRFIIDLLKIQITRIVSPKLIQLHREFLKNVSGNQKIINFGNLTIAILCKALYNRCE
jgi:uncharacterized membrane protein